MLSTFKIRGVVIVGIACVAALAAFMAVVGCSGDKEDVAVRTAKESRPVSTVPAAPEVDTTRIAGETEAAVVSKLEPPKEVTFEEAEAAFHEKRYDDAMELFTLYTDRKSENPWGYYMLGLSAWKQGEHEFAEDAFEQALELDPLHVKSLLNLSRVLLEMSRPKEAMGKINEAMALDPESNVAYRLRGRAYYQLGKAEEAIDAYRQAIQIDNEDAWSMNNMALVLIEEGRFDQALPPLARAVELRDDIAVFRNNLGMVLEHTGHFRAAEEAYLAAIAINESYENAVANLARVEAVVEDPGLEPVELEVIAQNFIEEIKSWSITKLDNEASTFVEPGADSVVVSDAGVSDADSTENSQEQ
ncbi:MAG: tetratricopeptide repeat protein [Candidatus Latescibacteria bacterium]|nr:tetratricopeptide repeat protein [Candidatus Latescibacterota bacterium]NIO57372.1 tetratricopeptide repeat protein [Candidatus Latescibacterota bacterium]